MNFFRGVSLLISMVIGSGAAFGADFGPAPNRQDVSGWSFTFTPYGWIPWMSGNTTVRGRDFTVAANPSDIFGHLDWSTLPAWMSYAEARRGPIGLFNDVVYASLSGSTGFDGRRGGPLRADVSADYTQVTVEFGGAYQVWTGANPVVSGSSALDLLAGGRYWHQDAALTGTLVLDPFVKETDRSGGVDWVDPFVGARLRNKLSSGDELVLRADFGGFGVGSDFSWQVLATYNWQMCLLNGYVLDGYVGYRALSVDYSQGSGDTLYKYDVLQQGPVIGSTLHF